MVRKFVTATASAALCLMSVAPGVAAAQEHRFTGFDAPRGVTATVNLRVPFGRTPSAGRASYGLTLRYGQSYGTGLDGRTATRSMNIADLRFTGDDARLSQARLAGFDLANLDQDRRMNLGPGGKKTWLILGILIALGVILCVTEFCDDDDDQSDGATSPGS